MLSTCGALPWALPLDPARAPLPDPVIILPHAPSTKFTSMHAATSQFREYDMITWTTQTHSSLDGHEICHARAGEQLFAIRALA